MCVCVCVFMCMLYICVAAVKYRPKVLSTITQCVQTIITNWCQLSQLSVIALQGCVLHTYMYMCMFFLHVCVFAFHTESTFVAGGPNATDSYHLVLGKQCHYYIIIVHCDRFYTCRVTHSNLCISSYYFSYCDCNTDLQEDEEEEKGGKSPVGILFPGVHTQT